MSRSLQSRPASHPPQGACPEPFSGLRATATEPRSWLWVAAFGLFLIAGAVWNEPSHALPLYASREGATCVTCHHDPNGGGIRNGFGFIYGRNRHAMEPEEKWEKVTVDPMLNNWIQIGLDTRVMYYVSTRPRLDTVTSTFFPMQGNVNLAVTPHDRLTLVAGRGIVLESETTRSIGREVYAMMHGLPGGSYFKIGRFRVPFGLRQDDHTSFIREWPFLPYDSQANRAGVELGAVGSRWFGHLAYMNDGEPFVGFAETFAAKVGYASRSVQIGLSGYHRGVGEGDLMQNRWSAYASATRGVVTWIGEVGAGTSDLAFGIDENVLAAFAEVDLRLQRGVNLRVKRDYAERDFGSGESASRRFVAEADFNPMPFVEFKLSYRHHDIDPSTDLDEYLAMLFVPF